MAEGKRICVLLAHPASVGHQLAACLPAPTHPTRYEAGRLVHEEVLSTSDMDLIFGPVKVCACMSARSVAGWRQACPHSGAGFWIAALCWACAGMCTLHACLPTCCPSALCHCAASGREGGAAAAPRAQAAGAAAVHSLLGQQGAWHVPWRHAPLLCCWAATCAHHITCKVHAAASADQPFLPLLPSTPAAGAAGRNHLQGPPLVRLDAESAGGS